MYKKIKKYILREEVIFMIISITLIISVFIFIDIKKNESKNIVINEKSLMDKEGRIVIYLDGEAKNKGIYYLEKEMTLRDFLNYTGGVTDNANLDKLDLDKILKNNSKIVIPKSYDYD